MLSLDTILSLPDLCLTNFNKGLTYLQFFLGCYICLSCQEWALGLAALIVCAILTLRLVYPTFDADDHLLVIEFDCGGHLCKILRRYILLCKVRNGEGSS